MFFSITRFGVLIPLVFSLLLAVVPLSSAFADSEFNDIETDYTLFDFSHYNITPTNSNSYTKEYTRSLLPYTYSNYPYYFYCVYCFNSQGYTNICVNYVSFYSLASESSTGAIFNSAYFSTTSFRYDKTPTSSWYTNLPTDAYRYFGYGKTNGYFHYLDTTDTDCVWDTSNMEDFSIIYQESNYPDFPYADDVIHGGGSALDVSVSFSPSLNGAVSRTIDDNGVQTTSNYFNMHITNNSRTDIQYFMAITSHDYDVFSGRQAVYNDYGDDVKFVFSSDEWVDRVTDYDMEGSSQTAPARRRSEWHKLPQGATNIRSFSWSQMQLFSVQPYDVVVYAYPLSDGQINVSTLHEYPLFDWSSCQEVYRSSFFLTSNTNYNPDDLSFGNYPNKAGEEMNHGQYSAYVDENGVTQYAANGTSFSNDDINNNRTAGSYVWSASSNSGSSSVSSDFSTLSNSFSTFFQFINRVFSFFPRAYQSVITCGLTALIVLGVLKVVIR